MTRHFPTLRTVGCAAVLGLLWAASAFSQDFSAQSAVDTDSVNLGDPIQFQIQVSGSDAPEEPDTSVITDFTVTPTGRGNNSTSSVTIINGRMTQDIRKGYLFNYQLIAKRSGTLTIPPITVKEGVKTTATQPVTITVGAAQETDDFKLRMKLAKSEIWAGESVPLDLTFYYKANLEQPQLRLPIADRPGFAVREVEIAATQDSEILDGKEYQIIKARRILIPQVPGRYPLEPATLSFRAIVGYRVQQDRFFGRQQVPNYRNFVIPSNPLELTVRALPTQGRPPGFSGHVGSFQITSSATPTKVNVGDPITLAITLSGPTYLQGIDLPPLQRQAELATNFRLPAERSPGQVQGDSLRFTQTIRVARAGVTEIPAIELPCFDPASGSYKIARSTPIPLQVSETRVVTAEDAEGTEPSTKASAEVEAWTRGIAYNYEDEGALRHQRLRASTWLRSGGFWSLLILPALAYLGLFALARKVRAAQSDPGSLREAGAANAFRARITTADSAGAVLDTLRSYLGDRLRLPGGALTSKDVRGPLQNAGVPEEAVAQTESIFRRCEASLYSGAKAGDVSEWIRMSQDTVDQIETVLSRSGLGPFSLARDFLKRIPGIQRIFPWLVLVLPLALILLPASTAQAASSPANATELFHQANALFRQANEESATDPQAASATYAKAILRFEQIIREGGIENGKLYYNVGNAYFRTRDIGRAIANYRRAQDLIPHDANVAQNLEFARSRRADRIEVPARQKVAQSLFFWHYDLTARTKATLLAWFLLTGWGAAAGRLFYPRPSLIWIAGTGGVLAVLFLGSLLLDARAEATVREGVIVAPEVVARKGDSETYEPSFKEPLHAGTEFRIREEREGWTQAELGDGRTCWLPEKAFERIW
jgi:tetratricopeptide (TPR) repeat protein